MYYTNEESNRRFRPRPRPNHTARYHECVNAMCEAGIDRDDAIALRRVAMTLHRWHELECGNGYGAIERDEITGRPSWRYQLTNHSGTYPIPDREKGALQRLEAIMSRYPTLSYYVQGDPRGAALYILRPGDVPTDGNVNAFYNRGIAVYK